MSHQAPFLRGFFIPLIPQYKQRKKLFLILKDANFCFLQKRHVAAIIAGNESTYTKLITPDFFVNSGSLTLMRNFFAYTPMVMPLQNGRLILTDKNRR